MQKHKCRQCFQKRRRYRYNWDLPTPENPEGTKSFYCILHKRYTGYDDTCAEAEADVDSYNIYKPGNR